MSAETEAVRNTSKATVDRALRKLFLTLFLRGRSARGLQRQGTPKSVGSRLNYTLAIYFLIGCVVFMFRGASVFALSMYLHGMTFAFLAMTISASAGEVLFNKEEGDILLHRPVSARALLKAKVGVLVEVSLWLAGAFNLAGFFVGIGMPDGGWRFPIVHATSAAMEALFCTSCIVLAYELCLRWFGREKLEGLMTTVQVAVVVAAVGGSQIVPRFIGHYDANLHFGPDVWWMGLLPPVWFAGFDDALAGKGEMSSWLLGGVGVASTALVVWLAFAKLAHHYEAGMQAIGESSAPSVKSKKGGRRWLAVIASVPPLSWLLRDPIVRASFLLTINYLVRDRDVKLRVYPGVAPMLAMPVVFLVQDHGHGGINGFGAAFAGGYLGLIPYLGLSLLRYSQQWQAADVFRLAPINGPARICHGARLAVLVLLTLPTVLAFCVLAECLRGGRSNLALLLPGIIALPIYALFAQLGGKNIPLSSPGEEAKSAGRGLVMIAVMVIALPISGIATWAWMTGWFGWMLLGEAVAAAALYVGMRSSLNAAPWPPLE